jgi:hypothetical protein
MSASKVYVTVSVSAMLEAYDKFQLNCPTVYFIKILSDSRVVSCAGQTDGRAEVIYWHFGQIETLLQEKCSVINRR